MFSAPNVKSLIGLLALTTAALEPQSVLALETIKSKKIDDNWDTMSPMQTWFDIVAHQEFKETSPEENEIKAEEFYKKGLDYLVKIDSLSDIEEKMNYARKAIKFFNKANKKAKNDLYTKKKAEARNRFGMLLKKFADAKPSKTADDIKEKIKIYNVSLKHLNKARKADPSKLYFQQDFGLTLCYRGWLNSVLANNDEFINQFSYANLAVSDIEMGKELISDESKPEIKTLYSRALNNRGVKRSRETIADETHEEKIQRYSLSIEDVKSAIQLDNNPDYPGNLLKLFLKRAQVYFTMANQGKDLKQGLDFADKAIDDCQNAEADENQQTYKQVIYSSHLRKGQIYSEMYKNENNPVQKQIFLKKTVTAFAEARRYGNDPVHLNNLAFYANEMAAKENDLDERYSLHQQAVFSIQEAIKLNKNSENSIIYHKQLELYRLERGVFYRALALESETKELALMHLDLSDQDISCSYPGEKSQNQAARKTILNKYPKEEVQTVQEQSSTPRTSSCAEILKPIVALFSAVGLFEGYANKKPNKKPEVVMNPNRFFARNTTIKLITVESCSQAYDAKPLP